MSEKVADVQRKTLKVLENYKSSSLEAKYKEMQAISRLFVYSIILKLGSCHFKYKQQLYR